MVVKELSNIIRFIGLSSDQKPVSTTNGSEFFEHDTGDKYLFLDGVGWELDEIEGLSLKDTNEILKEILKEARLINFNLYTITGVDLKADEL